jgi:hypothetical protein
VVELARPASLDELAAAFRAAEAGALAGILGTTDEELVSSDFVDDPRSAVVDLPLLQQAGPRLVRVVSWYDNEWGYQPSRQLPPSWRRHRPARPPRKFLLGRSPMTAADARRPRLDRCAGVRLVRVTSTCR